MNARVKNLKLQAKAATMIMAPRNASALECVVATKPLPVRRRSSVGVRSDGRASRMVVSLSRCELVWSLRICLCASAAYSLGELSCQRFQAM